MRTPPTLAEEKSTEIRLTIPVSAEVHEAFVRIAKATRMPIGRAMGEWLADTLDAAQFMAETLEKARAAPKLVAQELHAYALGIGDETRDLLEKLKEEGRRPTGRSGAGGSPGRTAAAHTPPSNTGVTTKRKQPRKGGTDGKNAR